MRKLLILALALVPAAAGCVDRGACLSSHVEQNPGYTYVQNQTYDGGKTYYPTIVTIPPSEDTVCDRWEFPDGRPEGR